MRRRDNQVRTRNPENFTHKGLLREVEQLTPTTPSLFLSLLSLSDMTVQKEHDKLKTKDTKLQNNN